ncbi:hypothetical protein C2S52_006754 [Perilla frutescens var. hirtella]|uniref:CASP-like protein n=1 Tax=Perilla frutescens var. hirtella TaxID=608512 RepID=A0AAD4P5J1_PERFH|nr:hypothetical protein C2S51_014523 [Perilla frutescens var. frutescens]KAH6777654.1 hypothetical protein C2S51_008966 [Perilla frutescens var. frutescens]KAH6787202.1 hypothetical protein C2S52_006754 [Perilla frutescens var. hirtella]KAH6827723.1 hypothetical protein C2S53_015691 [Perilla frutescens var. hirtella]
MGLLVLWSFGHACFDIYALRVNMDLYTLINVRVTVVGDWVIATLSLAAACSSAGVIVLFSRDTVMCSSDDNEFACSVIQMSVLFAFMSWSLIAVSSYLMLCLLATL